MAATNITFEDKILGQANPLPENKKLTFTNANEIKTVVNNNAAELTSTQGDVATNTSDIATNATNIATNATDIATNVTNIATNASGVAANLSSIATNTTDIATNTSGIATNVTDIATNTTNIATNTSNIATNVSNISTNTTNIATNTSGIATNASNIAANTSALADKANTLDVILKSDYTPSHSLLVQQNSTGSPSVLSVSSNTLIGRKSGGSSEIEDLNATETKEILLLQNVDNTSDLNKPISTATQTALDNKISKNVGTTYTTNALTTVTQAEYDALTPDSSTIYFII